MWFIVVIVRQNGIKILARQLGLILDLLILAEQPIFVTMVVRMETRWFKVACKKGGKKKK
jgi:hypothetical protein